MTPGKSFFRFLSWGIFVAAATGLVFLGTRLQRQNLRLQGELQSLDGEVAHLAAGNLQLRSEIEGAKRKGVFEKKRGEIEKEVSHLRELPFRKPVQYRQMPREELRHYILLDLQSQDAPEEFRNHATALKWLNLIPRQADLMKLLTDLLSEQVAAFYEPKRQELFTFDGLNLESNIERMNLAHELVHALQDQNFDLRSLPLENKANDDVRLAALALVEGDATREMEIYLGNNLEARQVFADAALLSSQSSDKLLSAPPFLRDLLLFPYVEGKTFVDALNEAGGHALVDRAFKDPPASTSQVIHPEKYLAKVPEAPKPVMISMEVKPEWKKIQDNALGEFGVRSLLSQSLGRERAGEAASGWRGDRYWVFDTGRERWVVIWISLWESPSKARDFFNSLEDHFHARYETHTGNGPVAGATSPGKGVKKIPPADSVFFSIANQKQNLTLLGEKVVYLDAPDSATMEFLINEALAK